MTYLPNMCILSLYISICHTAPSHLHRKRTAEIPGRTSQRAHIDDLLEDSSPAADRGSSLQFITVTTSLTSISANQIGHWRMAKAISWGQYRIDLHPSLSVVKMDGRNNDRRSRVRRDIWLWLFGFLRRRIQSIVRIYEKIAVHFASYLNCTSRPLIGGSGDSS